MSTERETIESKKAMAYDLFDIIDASNEKETYTKDEVKALIRAYIRGQDG